VKDATRVGGGCGGGVGGWGWPFEFRWVEDFEELPAWRCGASAGDQSHEKREVTGLERRGATIEVGGLMVSEKSSRVIGDIKVWGR